VKKYEGVFIKFMNYFHSAEYELGDSFTRDELLEIKPENIYNFMCLTAFGKTVVDCDDNPTGCRKDTLVYHKKALSYFMPDKNLEWSECRSEGNPTRAVIVNKLLEFVAKKQAKKLGKDPQSVRAMTLKDFPR